MDGQGNLTCLSLSLSLLHGLHLIFLSGLFRGYSAHALGSVLAFNLAYLQFSYLSDFFDDQNRIIDMYFRTYDKK